MLFICLDETGRQEGVKDNVMNTDEFWLQATQIFLRRRLLKTRPLFQLSDTAAI